MVLGRPSVSWRNKKEGLPSTMYIEVLARVCKTICKSAKQLKKKKAMYDLSLDLHFDVFSLRHWTLYSPSFSTWLVINYFKALCKALLLHSTCYVYDSSSCWLGLVLVLWLVTDTRWY